MTDFQGWAWERNEARTRERKLRRDIWWTRMVETSIYILGNVLLHFGSQVQRGAIRTVIDEEVRNN